MRFYHIGLESAPLFAYDKVIELQFLYMIRTGKRGLFNSASVFCILKTGNRSQIMTDLNKNIAWDTRARAAKRGCRFLDGLQAGLDRRFMNNTAVSMKQRVESQK
jgi:hypothetical protein